MAQIYTIVVENFRYSAIDSTQTFHFITEEMRDNCFALICKKIQENENCTIDYKETGCIEYHMDNKWSYYIRADGTAPIVSGFSESGISIVELHVDNGNGTEFIYI